jgi:hypothetical protein
MATALPAGWYADPADANQYRFWTGDEWTAHVRDRAEVDRAAISRPLPDFDTVPAPTVEPVPETTRRRRRLPVLLAVLGLVALVATAGAVTFGGSEPSGAGGQTLAGEVRVAIEQAKGGGGQGGFVADGTRCGTGRPPGVGAGTEVTVSNARGEVLGHTALGSGLLDRTLNSTTCVFTYEIAGVPDAEVYAVQVTGRPASRMTVAQLEASGWRADLRVG